ncbi:hypothetical protein [Spongorhabdus nitratireducens]
MTWQIIEVYNDAHITQYIRRTEVPGGWLVESVFDRIYRSTARNPEDGIGSGSGLTFVPDPEKQWQPDVIATVP